MPTSFFDFSLKKKERLRVKRLTGKSRVQSHPASKHQASSILTNKNTPEISRKTSETALAVFENSFNDKISFENLGKSPNPPLEAREGGILAEPEVSVEAEVSAEEASFEASRIGADNASLVAVVAAAVAEPVALEKGVPPEGRADAPYKGGTPADILAEAAALISFESCSNS